jgi:hypothetical protein
VVYTARTAFQIAGAAWSLRRSDAEQIDLCKSRWSSSTPAIVMAAYSKFLNPSMGLVRDLIPPMILFDQIVQVFRRSQLLEGIVFGDATAQWKDSISLARSTLRAWRYSVLSLGKRALVFAASSAAGMRMVLSAIRSSSMRRAMRAITLITQERGRHGSLWQDR